MKKKQMIKLECLTLFLNFHYFFLLSLFRTHAPIEQFQQYCSYRSKLESSSSLFDDDDDDGKKRKIQFENFFLEKMKFSFKISFLSKKKKKNNCPYGCIKSNHENQSFFPMIINDIKKLNSTKNKTKQQQKKKF